jgi:hypothetical protein
MVRDAQEKAGKVFFECDPRLVPLFARSFPDSAVLARSNPPDARCGQCDVHTAAGNLGAIFRATLGDFPVRTYLIADIEKVTTIKSSYGDIKKARGLTGKTIGISWQSKPLRHGDPKSTRLGEWENIFQNSPHLFVSLQYGDIENDIAEAHSKGWNLIEDKAIDQGKSLDDFAAQVAACDYVITVSNTTAHVAGALGIQGAVLLPRSRGLMWHWFDKLETSPWYPSLKLLRQSRDGEWGDILRDYLPKILSTGM